MSFHPFSRDHFAALAIGAVVMTALLVAGRRGGSARTVATALLVFFNLSAFPFNQAAWLSLGKPLALENILPLQLCDIAALTAGFALITRNPTLSMLTYFWGLAATLQALLTPALTVGFPEWPFFTFFVHHFAIVTTAVYLPVAGIWRPMRPLWKSPLIANAWSLGYLVIAMTANMLLGTNFGFISHPPVNPSIIDCLGPWPWYLASMEGIAIIFFLLLVLPFYKWRDEG